MDESDDDSSGMNKSKLLIQFVCVLVIKISSVPKMAQKCSVHL